MKSRVTKQVRALLVELASCHDEADKSARKWAAEDAAKRPPGPSDDPSRTRAFYRLGALDSITTRLARELANALGDADLGRELEGLADTCRDAVNSRAS